MFRSILKRALVVLIPVIIEVVVDVLQEFKKKAQDPTAISQ